MLTSTRRTIKFYRTTLGRCPVEELPDSLPDREAKKAAWVVRLVERLEMVPSAYFKKLAGADDLWEIRVQTSGTSYRFLGFLDRSAHLILTNGFRKEQQRTPLHEISLALRRRNDYLERKNQ